MATIAAKQQPTEIIYPDSDGKPMADNTLQADAMTIIYNNLRALYADNPKWFVWASGVCSLRACCLRG